METVMSAKQEYDVQTLLTHGGIQPDQHHGFVNTPIYRGSTVVFPSAEAFREGRQKYQYGRWGNPSTDALTSAIKALEGAEGTVLCPSGLAACSTAILALMEAGDHILIPDNVYSPVRTLCDSLQNRFNFEVTYYDPTLGADIESLVKPNTKVIYTESPGSLTMEVQDIPAIVRVARTHGAFTITDNTWGTPLFFPAIEHGIDLSVMAATKYIVGHSDAMLGTISASPRAWDKIKSFHALTGIFASPDDVTLALRGLRTLHVRLERHQRNAIAVGKWLEQRSEVKSVFYPALESHPQHNLWKRDFKGASGLLSFVTREAPQACVDKLVDSLKLFSIGYSWGGFESLVLPATLQSIRTAKPWEEPGHLIRLHVGLEDADDLIRDLEEALNEFSKNLK
ncbi:cystathionine beta-lyase [Pseudomonas sp. ITEM 17296]|nr:cystathionine beta-lyase [Pseudomonas sp. ITEM 17296]